MDILEEFDGKVIKLGVPKGCQGCQGCKGEGTLLCQEEDGMDITIDTSGEVYLYGGELQSLGSIYEETISYPLLMARMRENELFRVILDVPLKTIISELSRDEAFKKIIESTNYPYCVIKNLNKSDPEKLRKMLLAIE